jgi:hypothetical protein
METKSSNRATGKILVAALLLGTMASTSVFAQHRGYYRGGPRIGLYIGAPLLAYSLYRPYYSPYYYPPAYYPPVVMAPVPQTYVEQPQQMQSQPVPPPQQLQAPSYQQEAPQAAPQSGNMWYYCNEARAYYPYVKTCPAGWQQVTPQPQG